MGGSLFVLPPPVFAWLGGWMDDWYVQLGAMSRKAMLAGAFASVNLLVFLYSPVYCSYRSVRDVESELVSVRDELRRIAPPDDTLIVGFDSHFLGYRHAGYYFPEYLTIQFPELAYPDGKRVFGLKGRETQLLSSVPVDRFKRFILFPLPAGAAYRVYEAEVRRRFPNKALTSVVAEGREYVSGPAADLPILIPNVTAET